MKSRSELAVLFLLLTPILSPAVELKPETLQAWNTSVQAAKTRMEKRASGHAPFLWVDEDSPRLQQVKAGEILAEAAAGGSPQSVESGLIHDWIGAMFVPKARLSDAMGVLGDYANYREIYKPMVGKSALLEKSQNRERVSLVMVQKAFSVTAAVETENQVDIVSLDPTRTYSFSTSVRLQELMNYGEPGEHMLPADQGRGYVWRMFTLTRVEQRDDGVYIEMELMGLSRNIPWIFRWLVQPLAERLPRSILQSILSDTRDAIEKKLTPSP